MNLDITKCANIIEKNKPLQNLGWYIGDQTYFTRCGNKVVFVEGSGMFKRGVCNKCLKEQYRTLVK